jgi:hypothetical protein
MRRWGNVVLDVRVVIVSGDDDTVGLSPSRRRTICFMNHVVVALVVAIVDVDAQPRIVAITKGRRVGVTMRAVDVAPAASPRRWNRMFA